MLPSDPSPGLLFLQMWLSLTHPANNSLPTMSHSKPAASLPFPSKEEWLIFLSFIHSPGSHSQSLYWWQKAPNTSSLPGLSLDLSLGFGLSLLLWVALLTTPLLKSCLLLPSWMLLCCCFLHLLNVPSVSFTSSSSWSWNFVPQGMGLGALLFYHILHAPRALRVVTPEDVLRLRAWGKYCLADKVFPKALYWAGIRLAVTNAA